MRSTMPAGELEAITGDRFEREHPVPCRWCRRDTFANSAVCHRPDCRKAEATARRFPRDEAGR